MTRAAATSRSSIARAPLLVVACACLLVAGCLARIETAAPPADVLRVSYSTDPETLNPLTARDAVGSLFHSFVYEPLAQQNMANPDELLPCLAEKWEFNKERLEYTIQLRKGVLWHPMRLPNGVDLPRPEVTTRDVQFTFDCIFNPHIPAAARDDFIDVEARAGADRLLIDVTIVDRYTFKVRWKKPYFLSDESTLLVALIPRHVFSVDAYGDLISLDFLSREFAEGFNRHWASTTMCGTGPLIFSEWLRNRRVTLTRNHDYWGAPFHYERLVFHCEPNGYTLVQKLLQGELDWADIDDKSLYLQSRSQSAVTSGKVALKTYDYPGYRYIGYNLRQPLLRDKRVRQALTHAIPLEQIINVVFDGLATQVTGPFHMHSAAYNHQVKPLDYNLDKARQLLDAAGWRDTNRDGIRDQRVNGKFVSAHIDFLIEADSPQYLSVAEIIQNNWRKIGVSISITPAQPSLMSERMRSKHFDAILLGWALSWNADPYQTWFSGNAEMADSSNLVGYKNPEVDRLVTKLRTTFDRDEQLKLYHRVHKLIYDDQPYTFLFSEQQTCGYNTRVKNLRFYPLRPCVNFREWRAAALPDLNGE